MLREVFVQDGYIQLMNRVFQEHANVVLQKYPSSDDWNDNFQTLLRIISDCGFFCASLKV